MVNDARLKYFLVAAITSGSTPHRPVLNVPLVSFPSFSVSCISVTGTQAQVRVRVQSTRSCKFEVFGFQQSMRQLFASRVEELTSRSIHSANLKAPLKSFMNFLINVGIIRA